MAEKGRSVFRSIFAVILLGGTALGLINVFADNADITKMAEHEACAQKKCNANMTRMMRGPIGQSYTFQVEILEPAKGATHSVDVDCRRGLYLLGDYECKRLND